MTDVIVGRRVCSLALVMIAWLPACVGGHADGGGSSMYASQSQALNADTVIPNVAIHRLTRYAYNLTVQDLLYTNATPSNAFPVDPVNEGFDNVADTLTITPQLMGLYNSAAISLANGLTSLAPRWQSSVLAQTVGQQADPAGSPTSNWGWLIIGEFDVTLAAAQEDDATVSVLVGALATNANQPVMSIKVDNNVISTVTVTAAMATPTTISAPVHVTAGNHAIAVVFTNKVTDNATTATTDSELAVGSVTLASTTITQNPNYVQMFACNPNAADPNTQAQCWLQTALSFTQRAWRRPLTSAETATISALWTQLTGSVDNNTAMNFLVRSALVSPNFLYLATRPGVTNEDGNTLIDDFDMANRLSYFLWSSMPDAQLLQDANNGVLRTDDGLRAEVQRMLASPHAVGLQGGFAAQWLETRNLSESAPDPNTFPTWDANLEQAYINETMLFFNDFLTNGLPVSSMMSPNFVFANNRLAQEYGFPSPNSDTPVKMTLSPGMRAGLMTQGSWLVANSVQTRTSAVKRGRFVLQQLLCVPIGAPPPGVPALPSSGSSAPQTQRELLTAHVANPECAACHNILDPPGFGLEVFDGIGTARTTDANQPIDATGTLNGQAFNGPVDMARIIENDPAFVQCVTQQLYAYALNRTIATSDSGPLAQIYAASAANGNRLDEIITQIVLSPQFRWASNGAQP